MEDIRNIFCIGRNYAKHAEELGNEVPSEPLLFTKPTNALALADGSVLSFPATKGEIHYELEIVLKIGKDVEEGDSLADVISEMALGVDLTLRDVQSKLKEKGHPWLRAKGFRHSAILTPFFSFPGSEACKEIPFSLTKNGVGVQRGHTAQMIFSFEEILKECDAAFGLKKGDLLFTGTPEGVGKIADRDVFVLYWGEEEKGRFRASIA
ncbi:fumarylacetoacetate hydrolase family protein [Shouchella shacheensis]|uniref:fumarylacetoacetate hydrolase family protein n=1 Tax=Shouchella shacheensis TaxID=1649580 RepID=UPI0007402A38|nr:fumarylacetoacetate hydrolase family protein [Shouchella shacheensis]